MESDNATKLITALKDYGLLSLKVKELSAALPIADSDPQRISIMKQLVLAINSFDNHIKYMIKEFPTYYSEKKEIDKLMAENAAFLEAVMNYMRLLTKSSPN